MVGAAAAVVAPKRPLSRSRGPQLSGVMSHPFAVLTRRDSQHVPLAPVP